MPMENRTYTKTDCPLFGTEYCARLNMESCDSCTVRDRNAGEMEALKHDLDNLAALLPEEGIKELFLSETCLFCRGEEPGKTACYALTDIAHPEPKRKIARGVFRIKKEARAGSILPIQIACCEGCRKRFALLQNVSIMLTAFSLAGALLLMSIRPLREALGSLMPALPAILFLVIAVGGHIAGKVIRNVLLARYGKEMHLSVMRIEKLRQLKKLGWFELYEEKGMSRIVFSKTRAKSGLYTGGEPQNAAEESQNA